MREDGGDLDTAGALDVHEEAVGALNQSLELVLASLIRFGGVEEIVFQLEITKSAIGQNRETYQRAARIEIRRMARAMRGDGKGITYNGHDERWI
jgi:hypothetical protein